MKSCIICFVMFIAFSFAQNKTKGMGMEQKFETATLGGGCFWCTEAIYQQLNGVIKVESGYSGGTVSNPSYEEVCTGRTNHAEVIQVTFNPAVLSYKELLNVFFHMHDPTTLNRQGADVGTQYRSVIFYRSEEQKKAAYDVIKEVASAKVWDDPIVTEVTPFSNFYKAENYHQNYYNEHSNQPYCRMVINPKLSKFRREFSSKLKK
ncbi:MAG: peptide-methionine (S)-S-oxide reductase MsrA [Bacteroidota bacterium]|nr:peptide-methionine (S)-S-oxide reductase MsrA [Bacteroidota bacterium]